MTLTHDKVRALRDVQVRALHGCECPGNCICCDWATTAVALCDEWLARMTLEWRQGYGGDEVLFGGVGEFGRVSPMKRGYWAKAGCNVKMFARREDARAWIESVARKEDYEVSK